MARQSNQKRKLVFLRDVLLEYTDEKHPMTMKEIINQLAARGVSAERKSIYDDMETLKVLGLDIQTVRSRSTGYYVAKRDFELSELKLLVDAVTASKFIPQKDASELVKKLTSLAGIYDRPSLNRQVFVSNKNATLESDLFLTVDRIHEAIESDLDIKFRYFGWTVRKEKEFRRKGDFYQVSPWSLVWDDNNYYLVGFDLQTAEIRHFRVDKMTEIQITQAKRSGKEQFEKFDIQSYSDAAFGMFGGKMERVTLRCANRLANVMIDRFGSRTVILNDGESFRITVNVIPGPVFLGWVLSFGGEVEITSPENVKSLLEDLKASF